MLAKIFVVIVLVVIVGSLGSALYHLFNTSDKPEKMVKALTLRIALSIALFIFLFVAFALGWISPHAPIIS